VTGEADLKREPISDADLVRGYQQGDLDAFNMFIQRYQDRIYRVAGAMLTNPAHAEDAAQEVFLRAFRGLGRFRFGARPYTWLYAATRNVCREFNRKERNCSALDFDVPVASAQGRDLDERQCMNTVHALIRDLPERQRDVVLLRIFEELSVEETATTLGCRPGTVKATLHKALKKLRGSAELRALRGSGTGD